MECKEGTEQKECKTNCHIRQKQECTLVTMKCFIKNVLFSHHTVTLFACQHFLSFPPFAYV